MKASTYTPARVAKIASLAAAGATDSEIDSAVFGGKKNWKTRELSYVARRDAGLIPSRVGTFENAKAVTAKAVAEVLAEAPNLRAYALPIVFGFAPNTANVAALSRFAKVAKRPGRLASGKNRTKVAA